MATESVELLRSFFHLCGFQFAARRNDGQWAPRIFAGHLVLAFTFTIALIDYGLFHRHIIKDRPLRTINHLFPIASMLVTYWIIVLDSYLTRQRTFWKRFCELRRTFAMPVRFDWFLCQLAEHSVVTTMLSLAVCPYFFVSDFSRMIWAVFIISIRVYQSHAFCYIFHANIVTSVLRQFADNYKVIEVSGSQNNFLAFRQNYFALCQLIDGMNAAFTWSHLATILTCLHTAIADTNWTYTHFNDQTNGFIYCKDLTDE